MQLKTDSRGRLSLRILRERQIGTYLILYHDTYDCIPFHSVGDNFGTQSWASWMDYLYHIAHGVPVAQRLTLQGKDRPQGIFACPASNPTENLLGNFYGMNIHSAPNENKHIGGKIDKIARPTERVFCTDKWQPPETETQDYKPDPKIAALRHVAFRHPYSDSESSAKANALFFDGHVEPVTKTFVRETVRWQKGNLNVADNEGGYFWGRGNVWSN